MGRPGQAKPTQHTTPISTPIAADELVTVIDPRHPRFGQEFRLITITNKQHLGRCCVVLDFRGDERNLPLAVTNHSPEELSFPSSPLNLSGIENLLLVYAHIQAHLNKEAAYDGCEQPKTTTKPPFSKKPNPPATCGGSASPRADLANSATALSPQAARDLNAHLSAANLRGGRAATSAAAEQGGEGA